MEDGLIMLCPSFTAGYASKQLVGGMDIMTISDQATITVCLSCKFLRRVLCNQVCTKTLHIL